MGEREERVGRERWGRGGIEREEIERMGRERG